MKRFIALLMALAMLMTMVTALAEVETKSKLSGKCGSNLKYKLTTTGKKNRYGDDLYKLTITGSGKMYDYKADWNTSTSTAPWAHFGEYDVSKIELPDGLTYIGNYAFSFLNCELSGNIDVVIPEKVTAIGEAAFEGTPLGSVEIPKSVKKIGNWAFQYDSWENYGELSEVFVYSDNVKYGNDVFEPAPRMGGIPIIYGHKGSTTEAYCKKNSLHFEELEATPVKEIRLDKTELTLEKGKTAKVNATVLPANADNKKLKWSSADKSVATVANGKITAVGGGETTITAASRDGSGVTAQVKVAVTPTMPSKIKLNKSSYSLKQGKSVKLKATVDPSKADDKTVTWATSDESIAKVNKKGKVKAVAPGTCSITATTVNGLTATCKITVKPQLVTKVTMNKRSADIKLKAGEALGKTLTLTATVSPEGATNPALKWASSNEKIATVDQNGVVTSVGFGKCNITATATDGSRKYASCRVTVKKNMVTSIKLSGNSAMVVGATQQLNAAIKPPKAYDKTVTWSSSNESIATVDENGLVTALKPGKVTITCAANDGSKKRAKYNIKVVAE